MENSRIHRLSEDVINKIAAGEVVERPASTVKELMENALDAEASHIEVQIIDGGKTSILIRDNGCGMTEEDLNLCYLPHTTSKLLSADDLFHLMTNGFRGEAIASIAAISKLTITSRTEQADEAHFIKINGGTREDCGTNATPKGTTFLIEDLFFNAPVRKSFLGSDTLEASKILDTVTRLALANPNVRIDYKANGREIFTGVEGNDLKSRIAEALGSGVAKVMLPVDYTEDGIRVSGFVAPPEAFKNKRSRLYFYVQKRPIWNSIMTKAVTRAYEPYGKENAPTAVLFLEMQDTSVDVNVHPTKREVRFANENAVFLAVHHAVRDAFQKSAKDCPTIRLEDITLGALPSGKTECAQDNQVAKKIAAPTSFATRETPNFTASEPAKPYHSEDPEDIIQDLFSLPEAGNVIPLTPQSFNTPAKMDKVSPPQFFQLAKTYIVCEDSEGLLLIDQGAAHQRILYEEALQSLENQGTLETQELLFPELVELTTIESSFVPALIPKLDHLGFHLELFGKNTYQLRGIPRELILSRAVAAVHEMLSSIAEGENVADPTKETLAKAWALSNSYRAGDELGTEEMTALMAELLATQDPMTSPSGRPTLMRLPIADINKRFKR
ncbi:MAG: DNA mismatch repair endonuclease MutL [Fibrobacteraceae bacterium]|nr:DNA mismatch repair endonuclease MutL [Fibrobacteraceae bacterium]